MVFLCNKKIFRNQLYSLKSRCWALPHKGDSMQLYEDGYAPYSPLTHIVSAPVPRASCLRFSVADGVSRDTYGSNIWAALLTEKYVQKGECFLQSEGFNNLSMEWKKQVLLSIDRVSASEIERKIRLQILDESYGSATLNGLEIYPSNMTYANLAIGDSCFFHLHRGLNSGWELLTQNPEISADKFTNVTPQIATFHCPGHNWKRNKVTGNFQVGDIFILATDAISQWLVEEHPGYPMTKKVSDLLAVSNKEEYAQIISLERAEDRMVDDDVTVLIVETVPERTMNI